MPNLENSLEIRTLKSQRHSIKSVSDLRYQFPGTGGLTTGL